MCTIVTDTDQDQYEDCNCEPNFYQDVNVYGSTDKHFGAGNRDANNWSRHNRDSDKNSGCYDYNGNNGGSTDGDTSCSQVNPKGSLATYRHW